MELAVEFESLSYASVHGVVQEVCLEIGRLVVSADDLNHLGASLTLALDDEVEITAAHKEGRAITATVDPEPGADGSLETFGLASDHGRRGADDKTLALGDLAP